MTRYITSFSVLLNLLCYTIYMKVFFSQMMDISNEILVMLFFVFALQAIATYGSIVANGNISLLYFSISIYIIAWILMLLLAKEQIGLVVSTILMSIFPLFIIFFFLSLFEQKYLSKYRLFFLLQICTSINNIFIYFFLPITEYYTLSFLSCYICCFLICFTIYHQNFKDLKFRKIGRFLLLSFMGGFGPFLLFHIIPLNLLGLKIFDHFYWTIYFLLIFPITVLVLLRKLEITSRNYLVYTIFSNIGIFLSFFVVMDTVIYIILSPKITDLLRLNNFTLISVYLTYHIIKWKFETREQKLAKDISLFHEQKTNVSYQLLSNEQFESTAKIISEVLLRAYEFSGVAFVWSENDNSPYFLFKNKNLVNLDRKFIDDHHLFSEEEKQLVSYKNGQLLVIPMLKMNQVRGLILVSKEKSEYFSKNELNELSKSAEEITLFLHTTEQRLKLEKILSTQHYSEFERAAYIKKHDLAQEDKKKLANYLHDDVLQTILAVKNLNLSIESNDRKTIELIDQTLKSLSLSMRDHMTQIYPSFLSVLPLENSLKKVAENLEMIYQLSIDIDWHFKNDLLLTETEKVFFYRIFKELLINAYKHSKANKIDIELTQRDNENILRVIDNGTGIKRNQLNDDEFYYDHLGLLSIKQEVDYKNGKFIIYSGKEIGTDIEVKIPVMKGMKI